MSNNLTKLQKITVVLTIIWFLVAVAVGQEEGSLFIFLFCVFPLIIYWSIVWIFGFGCMFSVLKKMLSLLFVKKTIYSEKEERNLI
jgi:hypothetical protein